MQEARQFEKVTMALRRKEDTTVDDRALLPESDDEDEA